MIDGYAARIRAARAYAGMSQQQLGDALGVDVQWIKRREAGKQDLKLHERTAIAHTTGVPEWFIEQGFEAGESSALDRRVEALEHQMQLVIQAGLVRAGAAAAQATKTEEAGGAPEAPAKRNRSR